MLLPHPPCRGMGALYKRALEASWSITDRTAPVPLVVSPAVEFPLYLEPTVTMSSGGVPTSGKVSPPSYLDCPCIAGVVAGDITVPGWTIALTIFFHRQPSSSASAPRNPPAQPTLDAHIDNPGHRRPTPIGATRSPKNPRSFPRRLS